MSSACLAQRRRRRRPDEWARLGGRRHRRGRSRRRRRAPRRPRCPHAHDDRPAAHDRRASQRDAASRQRRAGHGAPGERRPPAGRRAPRAGRVDLGHGRLRLPARLLGVLQPGGQGPRLRRRHLPRPEALPSAGRALDVQASVLVVRRDRLGRRDVVLAGPLPATDGRALLAGAGVQRRGRERPTPRQRHAQGHRGRAGGHAQAGGRAAGRAGAPPATLNKKNGPSRLNFPGPVNANELRRIFIDFFAERGHTVVPSSGLIPHHPLASLFTNAGMNQFLPYLLGEETPPYPRATSVQKCVRVRGKHDDIELIGRTTRHLTFFEMLGSWSFGDYFKEGAIRLAWELVTERLGLDGERVWATVHETDDDAAAIWQNQIGLPPERIQRMGDDNFWEMGETGPCGPCSELYYDRGPEYGADGGPAHGGEERYVEFWNLVFMQYDRAADGTLTELPKRNIDTGAGLERMLAVLNNIDSVFDTDVLRAIVSAAERVTNRRYGDDEETDVNLRIIADHARTVTFLVNDGVFPSNEDRGYVLRRILRRAVRHAFQLGVETPVTPALVDATVEVMAEAYPDLARNRDFIVSVVGREEERFRQTLRSGSVILEEELAQVGADARVLPGEVAFRLHDTYGFPLELTREIAAERGIEVDVAGFETAMEEQRRRAREARQQTGTTAESMDAYREILEQFGTTEFVGYTDYEAKGRVLAVTGDEVFLDRTPFYAESGGQIGDTGTITTDTGTAGVVDTTYALPGLVRHHVRVAEGEITPGQEAVARIA